MKLIKVKIDGLKTKHLLDLEVFQGDLKKLSKEAKEKLKKNILKNGFIAPIFIWKGHNYILDGTQRLTVLRELIKEGYELSTGTEIPVVEIEADNKKQAGEYILSYNSQYGEITTEGLSEFVIDFDLEVGELSETLNMDFDILMLTDEEKEARDVEPEDVETIKTNIKRGDIFKLGEHRLMCGDAINEEDLFKLMKNDRADVIFTDPPYNLNFFGTTGKFEGFANDNIEEKEYDSFIFNSIEAMKKVAKETTSYYICIDYRNYPVIYNKLIENNLEIINCIVWDKVYAGLGFKYRFRHEFIVFAGIRNKIEWYGGTLSEDVIKLSKINTKGTYDLDMKGYQIPIKDGYLRIKKERDRTPRVPLLEESKATFNLVKDTTADIWEGYSINNFAQRELEMSDGQEHPTMKPIRMIMDFLENSSRERGIVLDVFGGSGSTLIACENTNRKCRIMEIDPNYCQVIINRWEALTNLKAQELSL